MNVFRLSYEAKRSSLNLFMQLAYQYNHRQTPAPVTQAALSFDAIYIVGAATGVIAVVAFAALFLGQRKKTKPNPSFFFASTKTTSTIRF